MRKVFLGSIILLILVGCNQKGNSDWYDTKEQAIEYGLEQEGTDESAVLSVEEFKGETIAFFEHAGSFGVASITENEKGFSWFRSEPYFDFDVEGDIPYTTNGFDFETKTGLEVSVLYGKAFDNTIQKMKLLGDGAERELEVFDDSKLFYAIHRQPFTSLEVVPVIKN
ncbi:hypothetical protein [Oceanobacillus rekensis]|uniref:hypothetical protein n=1 Tax=Oceanobacillus rekensis TaxID=937927 RepID=UPI000B42E855|nr:hypothetical protein [Oceanobacillus rekensis]